MADENANPNSLALAISQRVTPGGTRNERPWSLFLDYFFSMFQGRCWLIGLHESETSLDQEKGKGKGIDNVSKLLREKMTPDNRFSGPANCVLTKAQIPSRHVVFPLIFFFC